MGSREMGDRCEVEERESKMVGKDYIYGFFFQAEDGIRDRLVTGVQTCALPISRFRHEGHEVST